MTQPSISVIVNGEPRQAVAGMQLPSLLEALGVDRRLVAVALNGEVVPRDQHGTVALADGDRIEVVRMVGGG